MLDTMKKTRDSIVNATARAFRTGHVQKQRDRVPAQIVNGTVHFRAGAVNGFMKAERLSEDRVRLSTRNGLEGDFEVSYVCHLVAYGQTDYMVVHFNGGKHARVSRQGLRTFLERSGLLANN